MRTDQVAYCGATSGVVDFLQENNFEAPGTGIFEHLMMMSEAPRLQVVNPTDRASVISDNQHEMHPI